MIAAAAMTRAVDADERRPAIASQMSHAATSTAKGHQIRVATASSIRPARPATSNAGANGRIDGNRPLAHSISALPMPYRKYWRHRDPGEFRGSYVDLIAGSTRTVCPLFLHRA